MVGREPYPLSRVRELEHLVFTGPYSMNLVVVRGPGRPGEWDGVLYLGWVQTRGGGWTIRAWPCATRPGRRYLERPMNPMGTAILEPGQHVLSHRRGLHHGRPALVQVRPVRVRRDGDQDALVEPGRQTYDGIFGIHVHDVTDPHQLAGCIGVQPVHLVELLDAYDTLAAHQGPDVSLTLVE